MVFGSTVGLVSRCLFTDEPQEIEGHDDCIVVGGSQQHESQSIHTVDLSSSQTSYAELLHPNEENETGEHGKVKYKHFHKGCAKYLHRFDEMIMKPLFIYKYEKNMVKQQKNFFELFYKEGSQIEDQFKKSQPSRKMSKSKTIAINKNIAVTSVDSQSHSQSRSNKFGHDSISAAGNSKSGIISHGFANV